jgi:hypothetical protein
MTGGRVHTQTGVMMRRVIYALLALLPTVVASLLLRQ